MARRAAPGYLHEVRLARIAAALACFVGCGAPGTEATVIPDEAEPPPAPRAPSAAPPPLATPSATLAAPPPAARSARKTPFPPPSFAPPVERTRKPGDGTWSLLAAAPPRSGKAPSTPLARTTVHPHKIKPFVIVDLVAIDPAALDLELVAGTEEPENPAIPAERRTGLVPTAAQDRLVVAMNGGFKRRHGKNGMAVGADEFVPFHPEGCVVARVDDASFRVGTWTSLVADRARYRWARQTPPCLVENGAKHPDTKGEYGQKKWGGAEDGNKEIRRSALGISADGETLYFAIGDWVTAEAIADALVAAGVHAAAELDINYSYTRFVLYERDGDGALVATSPLLSELKFGRTEYWKTPAARDFFYLAWR